jgi:hypothetical protein
MSLLGLSLNAEAIAGLIGALVALIIFFRQQRRLLDVEKQQTYQRLELASNELFRFAADNAAVLTRYMKEESSADLTDIEKTVADNHINQTLNLFEMAARLRRAKFFEDEIFGSWVIWYYEMLGSWYFRHKWPEIRPNYTSEMRLVFDEPIRNFDPNASDAERKQQFFAHVAKVLKCPIVRSWLVEAR